jgi:hypothetical protein
MVRGPGHLLLLTLLVSVVATGPAIAASDRRDLTTGMGGPGGAIEFGAIRRELEGLRQGAQGSLLAEVASRSALQEKWHAHQIAGPHPGKWRQVQQGPKSAQQGNPPPAFRKVGVKETLIVTAVILVVLFLTWDLTLAGNE